MRYFIFFILVIPSHYVFSQTFTDYEISFENAVHHEANVSITFRNLKEDILEVRMSRSSPGRYAIHEFAKNVYNVKALDGNGRPLIVTRPNPYQWNVAGHNGTVKFTYTLFANRADGTYSQIDETHAHLNMPATFAYARGLDYRPIKMFFKVRDNLKWKVATQLRQEGNYYFAPNFQYMMDSPVELSNFTMREFEEESDGKKYKIRLALHCQNSEAIAGTLLEEVKKVVKQEKAVMGGFPNFDFGTYTFMACYTPQASDDAMEHRNSTFISGSGFNEKNIRDQLGSFSHEFFHCWNVERMRPAALEPFNFEQANMSGELWFAEGFTEYYTDLILCRAGMITQREYVEGLSSSLNSAKNGPGRNFFNPIQMSYQAPFSDRATSIDPTNMKNVFISYYTYGKIVGLMLDLMLRNMNVNNSLDDYMKVVWNKHGKTESPYTVRDLKAALAEYTSPDFADDFFDQFIYGSSLADFEKLFNTVGVSFTKAQPGKSYLGAVLVKAEGGVKINENTLIGTPAYKAGLENEDVITSVNNQTVDDPATLNEILSKFSPGKEIIISYKRFDREKKCTVLLEEDPSIQTKLYEDIQLPVANEKMKKRSLWLGSK